MSLKKSNRLKKVFELLTFTDSSRKLMGSGNRYIASDMLTEGDIVYFICSNDMFWQYVKAQVKYADNDNSILVDIVGNVSIKNTGIKKGKIAKISLFDCVSFYFKDEFAMYQIKFNPKHKVTKKPTFSIVRKARGITMVLSKYLSSEIPVDCYVDIKNDIKELRQYYKNK